MGTRKIARKGTRGPNAPKSMADVKQQRMYAEQRFDAIILPAEPLDADAMASRGVLLRLMWMTLQKNSDELHATVNSPAGIGVALDLMDALHGEGKWLSQASSLCDKAHLRLLCVLNRAFLEHPEWKHLPAETRDIADAVSMLAYDGSAATPQKRRPTADELIAEASHGCTRRVLPLVLTMPVLAGTLRAILGHALEHCTYADDLAGPQAQLARFLASATARVEDAARALS